MNSARVAPSWLGTAVCRTARPARPPGHTRRRRRPGLDRRVCGVTWASPDLLRDSRVALRHATAAAPPLIYESARMGCGSERLSPTTSKAASSTAAGRASDLVGELAQIIASRRAVRTGQDPAQRRLVPETELRGHPHARGVRGSQRYRRRHRRSRIATRVAPGCLGRKTASAVVGVDRRRVPRGGPLLRSSRCRPRTRLSPRSKTA